MTHKRLLMRVIDLLILTCIVSTSAVSQSDFSAHVTSNEITVSFPIDDASDNSYWKWNLPETRMNDIEYQFTAKILSESISYEFGYFHFKFRNAVFNSGNFRKLIQSGQTSIFRTVNGSGKKFNEGRVVTRIENNKFIVTISGSEAFHKIFSLKPKDLQCIVRMPNRSVEKQYVTITYQ